MSTIQQISQDVEFLKAQYNKIVANAKQTHDFSALAGTPTVTDYVRVDRNGQSFKVKLSDFLGTSSITTIDWGSITGDISSNNDLQSALDNKEDKLGTPAGNGYTLKSDTNNNRYWELVKKGVTSVSNRLPDANGNVDVVWGGIKGDIYQQNDLFTVFASVKDKNTWLQEQIFNQGITINGVKIYKNAEGLLEFDGTLMANDFIIKSGTSEGGFYTPMEFFSVGTNASDAINIFSQDAFFITGSGVNFDANTKTFNVEGSTVTGISFSDPDVDNKVILTLTQTSGGEKTTELIIPKNDGDFDSIQISDIALLGDTLDDKMSITTANDVTAQHNFKEGVFIKDKYLRLNSSDRLESEVPYEGGDFVVTGGQPSTGGGGTGGGSTVEKVTLNLNDYDLDLTIEQIGVSNLDSNTIRLPKEFTDGQKDKLLELIYKNLTHTFTLNKYIFEKGVSTNVTASFNIVANDDTDVVHKINGSSKALVGTEIYSITDTTTYSSIVTYKRNGTNGESRINRTITAVYASYFGSNKDGHLPTETEIKAGVKTIKSTNSSIAHKFTISSSDGLGEYGWFAVEKAQTGGNYTKWSSDASASDNGAIGGFILLKGEVTIETTEGTNKIYQIYMFDQAKDYNNTITLTK